MERDTRKRQSANTLQELSMTTVVIASYKYGHLSAHCIESVLSQTKQPEAILFVDDGAGDCTHLPKIYPEIEYIFRDKNLGTVNNFQDMLMKVETERVLFIGADNWLRSDALEILEAVDADIVTYDIVVTGELKDEIDARHGFETKEYEGDLYWDRAIGHHGSMLYRTKLGQEVGYSSPPGRTIEDLVLYNEMRVRGATRKHVAEPLLYYRRHRENFNLCI